MNKRSLIINLLIKEKNYEITINKKIINKMKFIFENN